MLLGEVDQKGRGANEWGSWVYFYGMKYDYRAALEKMIAEEHHILRTGYRSLNKNVRPWAK